MGQRPADLQVPKLPDSPPVPEPEPIAVEPAEDQPTGRNPTRYDDWEYKGIAIDFS